MNPLKFFKAMLNSVPRLPPADCAARVRAGDALLIDVREAREWADGVAQHAALLPLSDLHGARTHWAPFLARAGQRELLLYCAVGGRAGIAAKLLAAEGWKVANTGGLTDWLDADWPIVKPAAK